MDKKLQDLVAELSGEIALQNLKDAYQLNKEMLDEYYHNGKWLHRDDLEDVSLTIHHLKAVIEYYGGYTDA